MEAYVMPPLMGLLRLRFALLQLLLLRGAVARVWVVNGASAAATDSGPATKAIPLKTISAAATKAQPYDVVTVHGGAHIYRERVAPASGDVSYTAAPGVPPIVRGSVLVAASAWRPLRGAGAQPGVWAVDVSRLPYERVAGESFNPYAIRLAFPGNESTSGSDGSSCDGGHTLGQVFQGGRLLKELSGARTDFHCACSGKADCTGGGQGCPGTYRFSCGTACGQACGKPCGLDVNCSNPVCDDDNCGCSHAGQLAGCCNFTHGGLHYTTLSPMSWMAVKNGTEVWARFAKEEEGDNAPTDAEITVRKSVFAPHMRGLGNITVRGFVFEHAGTPILAYFICSCQVNLL